MSFLDKALSGRIAATKLATLNGGAVAVDGSNPSSGQLLRYDGEQALWTNNIADLVGVLGTPQRANKLVAAAGDLTVGAIADGQMLVRSGANIISQAIPTTTPPTSPVLLSRATPHALDDEFTTGSGNLATRGWNVTILGSSTPLTYAGEIQPYAESPPAASTYRATITPAGLYVQPPQASNPMCVWKPISGSFAVSAITSLIGPFATAVTLAGPSLWSAATPSESPGGGYFAAHSMDQVGSGAGNHVSYYGQQGGTTYGTSIALGGGELLMGILDWNNTTKFINITAVEAISGRPRYSQGSGPIAFAAFTPANVGFVLRGNNGNKGFHFLRSFRVWPQGVWPGLI